MIKKGAKFRAVSLTTGRQILKTSFTLYGESPVKMAIIRSAYNLFHNTCQFSFSVFYINIKVLMFACCCLSVIVCFLLTEDWLLKQAC